MWRIDRLGRSLSHLIDTVETLEKRGVAFRPFNDPIDTRTSSGKPVFQIFGALSEFGRNIVREPTMAGLSAARDRGQRRRSVIADSSKEATGEPNARGGRIHDGNCGRLDVARSTMYGNLQWENNFNVI